MDQHPTYRTVKPPKLKRDWEGHLVRVRRELANGLNVVPEGTVATISYYTAGKRAATIKGQPCGCCGVSVVCSGLTERDMDFLVEVKPEASAT